ncbi:excisionase family DNA-binding protein [Halalkalibacillus halophilus]|uniref:excisionase family DNA-binding protein n=1 Tax=Halalkalibacillus halophilus TaxID=392827 RepID=UPI0004251845|nr:excisionase family DNA-binding protein [Halalkalibacillus halophilus]
MYLTVTELADYLELPETHVENLVLQGQIRSIHDGNQFLINREQFSSYFDQMKKYRQMIQDYLEEPLPEDPDVNDED